MLRAVGGLTRVCLRALTLTTACEVLLWVADLLLVLDGFAGVVADFAGVFFGVGFLVIEVAVVFDVEGDVPAVSVAASPIPGSSRQATIAARRIGILLSNIA
jgi:hypothetical protein